MSALDLNLSAPLRSSVMAVDDITALLGQWAGEPSVHTRRPAPTGATFPMIIISSDIALGDADALNSSRPLVTRDLIAYGQRGAPGDSSDQLRDVESIGYLLRARFHRQPRALIVPSYNVVQITCSGPFEAPTDDDTLVARGVSLSILLQQNGG